MLTTDPDGAVRYISPQVEEILGQLSDLKLAQLALCRGAFPARPGQQQAGDEFRQAQVGQQGIAVIIQRDAPEVRQQRLAKIIDAVDTVARPGSGARVKFEAEILACYVDRFG